MREIRFRAWHEGVSNSFGKQISPPQMLFDEKPGDCLVFKNQGQPVKLMQFTGLKDKNGKEIYEGDIVRGEEGEIAIVEWWERIDCDRFWQTASGFVINFKNGYYSHADEGDYEVIGNIYENPELLVQP